MKAESVLLLIKFIWRLFLRDLVQKTIDDPDTEWDDTVMDLLDTALGHTKRDEFSNDV